MVRTRSERETAAPRAPAGHNAPMPATLQPDPAASPLAALLARPFAARLALAALVAIAFGTALQAGLVLDAPGVIAQDPRLHGLDGASITDILFDDAGGDERATAGYRPLTTLSYALQYAGLGCGVEPFGYALGNVLLHLLNVLLLHACLCRATTNRIVAFAAAALWAVHPLASEAVANLVGRADLIAACGVLCGYALFLDGGDGPFSRLRSVGIALAQLLAVGGKESGIVLMPLLVLADLCKNERAPWRQRIGDAHFWTVAALVLWAILRAIAVDSIPTPSAADNPLLLLPLWQSVLAASLLLLRYLCVVFWPASLSCDWSFDALPVTEPWFVWAGVAATGASIAVVVIALRHRATSPTVAFLALAWFVALAPVANVAMRIGTVFGERLAYLPMAMPIALACIAARRLRPHVATALLVACLAALATRANLRNLEWRSNETLWTAAVATAPGSFKTHGSYAVALHERAVRDNAVAARIDDVLRHAETARDIALRLPARDVPADTLVNHAAFLRVKASVVAESERAAWRKRAREEYDRAIDVEREALAADGAAADARHGSFRLWLAHGQFLGEEREHERAVASLRRAVELAPMPETLLALADAALAAGNAREAALAAGRATLVDSTSMLAWQAMQRAFEQWKPGGVAVVRRQDGSPGFNTKQDGLRSLLIDAAKAQRAALRAIGQHKAADQFAKRAGATLGVRID